MISKLKENRVLRSYLGGERIDRFLGKEGKNCYYPEDWTASVVKALNPGSTKEDEGYGYLENGTKVKDIINGDMRCLVKLLDSSERLVIQVHPTIEFAGKYFNSKYGKTECWYFLDCDKDACVYLGFKKGITKDIWEDAFNKQDTNLMLSLLNKISVNKGDCIFVNDGEPHAIGAGCFMIETQEPTDLMGIVERHTVTGRELSDQKMHCGIGFDNMLKMFNYNGYTKEEIINKYKIKSTQIDNNIYPLVDERYTEKFIVLKLMNDSILKKHITNGVLIVVNGNGKINNIDVKKGDRLFIDSIDEIYTSGNNLEVVVCY